MIGLSCEDPRFENSTEGSALLILSMSTTAFYKGSAARLEVCLIRVKAIYIPHAFEHDCSTLPRSCVFPCATSMRAIKSSNGYGAVGCFEPEL